MILAQSREKPRLVDALLFLNTCLFIVLLVSVYVSSERFFYFSDHANYQNLATNLWASSETSWQQALKVFSASLGDEYNLIFAVGLLPIFTRWGNSRLAFELGIALLYLLPYALVIGGLATRLIDSAKRAVFWTAVIVALGTPSLWVPLLRGYPDVGAAMFVGLALYLYLGDMGLKRAWRSAGIGIFLALAMLFRRPYTYDVLAFFAALALITLVQWIQLARQTRSFPIKETVKIISRIGIIGIAFLLILSTIGLGFLERALGNNYLALYDSLTRPWYDMIAFFGMRVGWITWFAALSGLGLGFYFNTVRRPELGFFVLFQGLCVVLWTLIVRQVGIQYTLHMILLVIIGIVIFGWTLWLKLRPTQRLWVPLLAASFLVFMMVSVLVPLRLPSSFVRWALLPENDPPLYDQDYDTIAALVNYLHQQIGADKMLYIVFSNGYFTDDLLRNADRIISGDHQPKLSILRVPLFDSRDTYPLEQLLRAQYVLYTKQAKRNITTPSGMQVNDVVFQLFEENQSLANDFREIKTGFKLKHKIGIHMYERVQATQLQTIIETLRFIQTNVKTRPGQQPDWIRLNNIGDMSIAKKDQGYAITIDDRSIDDGSQLQFLYVGKIPLQAKLQGVMGAAQPNCPTLALELHTINHQNQVALASKLLLTSASAFSIPFSGRDADYLVLKIYRSEQSSIGGCTVPINNLEITP